MISCVKLMERMKDEMNESPTLSQIIDTKTCMDDIPRKIYPGMVSMRGNTVTKLFNPKVESVTKTRVDNLEKSITKCEKDEKSPIKSLRECGLKRPSSSSSCDSFESLISETPDVMITSVYFPKRSRNSDASDSRSSSESFPSPIVVKPVDDHRDMFLPNKCGNDKMMNYQSSPDSQTFKPQVIVVEDLVKIFNSLTNNTSRFNFSYGQAEPSIAGVIQDDSKKQMGDYLMSQANKSAGYRIHEKQSLRSVKDAMEIDKNFPTRTDICYRKPYQQWQIDILAKEYRKSPYIRRDRKIELAKETKLSPYQIKVWFQNRRSKDKAFIQEIYMC